VTYTPPIDPDPREEKLPRWARDLLSDMRMRVQRAEADAEAALLATDPGGCDTTLYRYGSPSVGLGHDRPTVQFRLGDKHREYVMCRIEDSKSYPRHVYVNGGDSIRIEPVSSNTVRIYTID
jgi:hypothetical protein